MGKKKEDLGETIEIKTSVGIGGRTYRSTTRFSLDDLKNKDTSKFMMAKHSRNFLDFLKEKEIIK